MATHPWTRTKGIGEMKMILRYWIVMVTLCSSIIANGSDFDSAFSDANKEYINGNYAKSIEIYSHILQERGYSAEVLYNTGNSYYKSGDIGNSILSLERAIWLDPGNADIVKNLNAIRKNTGLMSEEESLVNHYIGMLTLNQWTGVAASLIFVFACCVIGRSILLDSFSTRLFRNITIVLICFGVVSLYGVVNQSLELERAIVTSSGVEVLISPFDGAEQVASLKTGRVVYVLKKHADYYSVKESSGTTGWVKISQITKVIP